MATFLDQVNALTSLEISGSTTDPSQNELSEFLRDGVKDVVNRIIALKPQEASKFSKTTESATNNTAYTGKILSVVREHDSETILRRCTPISSNLRYLATDEDSIHYRSKSNPGYYILQGVVCTVPAPGGSSNSYIVDQVHYDVGLAYGDNYNATTSTIANFPIEYEYLVAIYAAIKSLESKMANFAIDEEDTELVQAISANLNSLKQEYASAFASMASPQPQQAGGR